jgi:methylated-DNA-[protein]-cysteine S-methyltransferase
MARPELEGKAMKTEPLARRTMATPVGPLLLEAEARGLASSEFSFRGKHPKMDSDENSEAGVRWLDQTEQELTEYFAGKRREFTLALRPLGTPFQRSVWLALGRIPYGETWSYRQLALEVGSPQGFRAVGAANGRNPLPVIVPCHRVIGSNGSLTGFGGGLPRKKWLLEHEQAHSRTTLFDQGRAAHP